MTLCIAATCQHAATQTPALVLCCDARGDRGLVGSDDSETIRWVSPSTSVLIAGSRTRADDLFYALLPALEEYSAKGKADEIHITQLLQSLRKSTQVRKREIMNEYTWLNLGMALEDFQKTARDKLLEAHYFNVWEELRKLHLGADLIIATFGQDEPVIIRVCATGEVFWENHYSTIGAGSPIAEAFLCQREYDDFMSMEECIYRVYEARVAAEKNKDVGLRTMVELLIEEEGRFTLSLQHYITTDEFVRKRYWKCLLSITLRVL